MKVEEELKEFTPQRDTVLTIGVFDGVHIGHQRLMEYVRGRRWPRTASPVWSPSAAIPAHHVAEDSLVPAGAFG